ncbi:MAG: NAD(P)/FAD-dependent oxidoreductase [Verrucomicrobia bacterium]|nr:NAD(P)/FAD-dependent oxidoreductase [Verrucomicrobiota bacterium]
MNRPKILIAGAGFGGLTAASALAHEPVEVVVLDRLNHHLFQPLLYQVATAALSPAQIAQPIRHILRHAKNITVAMAEIVGVEPASNRIITRDRSYPYDYLILATGSRHFYFGHPEWEPLAPGLKSIDDALEIRRRLLFAFEEAEKTDDPAIRAAALTFVVIGGGPTGVEMAGAIGEIARYTMVRDFRRIDPSQARIVLLEAAPRILPALAETLSAKASAKLRQLGVEVRTGTKVSNVRTDGVEIDEAFIPSRTVLWTAGNAASPLGKMLGTETDRVGRVWVSPDLTPPGRPNIFVIGDLANFSHQTGSPLPGVSPVAMQQARHAVRNILAKIDGRPTAPFHYFDKGTMATIGRRAAVADIRGLRFNGFLAWLAWLFVHLIFLVGFRNRVLVFLEWTWSYFNFYRGARLITGTPPHTQ